MKLTITTLSTKTSKSPVVNNQNTGVGTSIAHAAGKTLSPPSGRMQSLSFAKLGVVTGGPLQNAPRNFKPHNSSLHNPLNEFIKF